MGKALYLSLPSYQKKAKAAQKAKATKKQDASRRRLDGSRKRFSVRRVTPALAKAKRAYNARVAGLLASNPVCVACGERWATENHHVRGRVGKLLMDERYWILLCNPCHAAVHQNPGQAIKDGLLCQKSDWNKPGPVETTNA